LVVLWQVLLRPAADTGNRLAFHRLQADDLDRRVLLLEVARHAHDGASGAHGTDEMGDAAAGLLPEFGAGTAVMRFGVVAVGELVEHLATALCLHLQRLVAGAVPALCLTDEGTRGTV